MNRQRLKGKILKLLWLQAIMLACAGSMIPGRISFAACSHDYVIQQTKEPGSGKTDSVCAKCGDTKQITIPTELSYILWMRGINATSSPDGWIFEIGDEIKIRAASEPYNVDNREMVAEISNPSIVTIDPVEEGSNDVTAFTITGRGELTVTVYLKYDPSLRVSSTISIPEITDEMVNGGPGGPKDFTGLDVEYHTQKQIRDYYLKYPNYNLETKYRVAPSLKAPYVMGELSKENQQDALNLLNLLRYITGVPTVSISAESQKAAQSAATVFAINETMGHLISEVPPGMSEEMIYDARNGAFNSNIVGWRERLGDAIMAFMIDTGNYDTFGHRMQLLKPHYDSGAGFGIATTKRGISYSAVFVDAWFTQDTALAYPGQNQPIEYFGKDYGWTIVLPQTIYTTKANVKLTNVKTGKTWNFNKASKNLTFYQSFSTCFIFFPENIEYKEGDKYKVEITGIESPISYEVNFFRLTDGDSIERADVSYSGLVERGCTFDGTAQKPRVFSVRLGTYTLTEGTDYTVSYENNKNVGTAKIKIKGKGHYRGTITKTFKIKERLITKDVCQYRLIGKSEVECLGLAKDSKRIKYATIPDTITISRKDFKVKSIAANAFRKTKLKNAYIGKNVTSIGKAAFKDCKKITLISIESARLKTVGKNAFKGIKANAKIRVPAKKLKAYKKLLKGKGQGKKVKIIK